MTTSRRARLSPPYLTFIAGSTLEELAEGGTSGSTQGLRNERSPAKAAAEIVTLPVIDAARLNPSRFIGYRHKLEIDHASFEDKAFAQFDYGCRRHKGRLGAG